MCNAFALCKSYTIARALRKVGEAALPACYFEGDGCLVCCCVGAGNGENSGTESREMRPEPC